MDAFYASVEQRDNPDYRGKPIVVGGPPEGRGGVVATASYEARKYGIRSAMPSKKAKQLCPEVIFVKPRFSVYKEVSQQIRGIFRRYTDLIEPLSLDEAYLDVTADKQNIGSAIEIAKLIKQAIRDELQLTASAGISINKFVAKIASDMNKPDGMTFIGPSSIVSFIEKLPVEKFFGVGKVTSEKMKKMGIFTGADLKTQSKEDLVKYFGKAGGFYFQIARGIDEREVQPNRETKSIGAEDTFAYDLTEIDEMCTQLDKIAQTVHNRLQNFQLKGRTVTLKIKYSDFRQITRNFSVNEPSNDLDFIIETAKSLLMATQPEGKRIRLLGVTMSNFGEIAVKQKNLNYPDQLELF
jgi:DNA polymerase-4